MTIPRYVLNEKSNVEKAEELRNFAKLHQEILIGASDQSSFEKLLDVVDILLTLAGFIPGVGIPIDIISAGIGLLQQDYLNVCLSIINAIPIVGYASAPIKLIKAAAKLM